MTSPPALSRPVLSALSRHLDAECIGGGTVSLWVGDRDGTCWFERDAHLGHYAASTMKLPLAIAAHQLIASGALRASEDVPVHNNFRSAFDGSAFAIDEAEDQDPDTWAALGASLPFGRLVEHAVTHSGNLATNLVLEIVGVDRVQNVLAVCGTSPVTVIGRGIEDAAAREHGITNTVTAADLGIIMAAVARDDDHLGGAAVTGEVLRLLAGQQHLDQIPAGLPVGTWSASKSGWVTGVSHDVALVRPARASVVLGSHGPSEYVIAVCTSIDRSEQAGAALVASVSRAVWKSLAL